MALDDDREFNPKANPGEETPSTGPIAWLKRMFAGEPAPVDANRSEAPIPITTSDAQLETVIDRLMDKVSIDQINKSNLLTVIAYSADPAMPQRIPNQFVPVTIKHQLRKPLQLGKQQRREKSR